MLLFHSSLCTRGVHLDPTIFKYCTLGIWVWHLHHISLGHFTGELDNLCGTFDFLGEPWKLVCTDFFFSNLVIHSFRALFHEKQNVQKVCSFRFAKNFSQTNMAQINSKNNRILYVVHTTLDKNSCLRYYSLLPWRTRKIHVHRRHFASSN